MEAPPVPAWDQRCQDEGNSVLETKLCMEHQGECQGHWDNSGTNS